ncbi:MAG: tRNA pseudouridine(55) synthase TruB [Candidatus Margulisbacteria bacterium]|nr:tRNA pseudouridine(55) synthase TruB [Candidatus Margulisiibacteriota bacterium]
MQSKPNIPHGFYNINKPQDWTSFDVVNKFKHLANEKKVGHAGTLDPLATGVLVVAVGKSFTKKLTELSGVDKEYEFEVTFGIETESHDLAGEVVRKVPPVGITKEKIEKAMPQFIGEIDQFPPKYSAIKKDGKKLYEYARAGIEVEIESRAVTVYEFELLSFTEEEYPKACFRAKVSKGTYVRSIAYDLGVVLGTVGVCSGLVRTAVGDFLLKDSKELSSFYEVKA